MTSERRTKPIADQASPFPESPRNPSKLLDDFFSRSPTAELPVGILNRLIETMQERDRTR